MPTNQIRLLALDGGGVRGLSSLMILQQLMDTVDPESPPKPCDYFDMIGGTSTGGLIAIMLGRLQMTVDDCISAYTSLSDRVFEKKGYPVNIKGKIRARFDTAKLERAIEQIVEDGGFDKDTLLKDSSDAPCKVFVCATSKQTSNTVCLTSYRSPRGGVHLLESAKIWQACRATSAATSFFDPIAIGPFDEEFVDGALGANNPVYALWNQAQDVWGDQLWGKLNCLVSIGTGMPTLNPVSDDVLGIWETLQKLATETEETSEQFRRDKSSLDDEGRYYRFNVDRGLEHIGLEESKKKKDIASATGQYIASQAIFKQMKACANNLAGREYHGPYRTVFTLQGVPISDKFVNRPSDLAGIRQCLLPRSRSRQTPRRRLFVLYGLGGIGKTQLAVDFARRHQATFSSIFWLDGRSEDRLRQSLASCANRIPKGQIPERSSNLVINSEDALNAVVVDVLAWLARPDNINWLLIFDNVDQDYEQDSATGAYDVRKYLPGDHGSILITTRLSQLAQLGSSKRLRKVDEELSKSIFQQWYGRELVMDETGRELVGLLDGLPLALAQAGSYLRETELDTASYVRLYKQQWDDLIRSDSTPLVDYHRSIKTTWTISFKAIEGKSKNATNLLRLWAFLDNKALWYGLLQAATDDQKQWPAWLHEIACNEVDFLGSARLLLRYSMIEAEESMQGSYVLHPVVHRWISHIQNVDEKREFLRLAVIIIGLSVPSGNSKGYWMLQSRLLPHAQRCTWWVEEICKCGWTCDINTVDGIHQLGVICRDQGKLEEADKMFQLALSAYEKALGPDHLSTLRTVKNFGRLYIDQGNLDKAEKMFQRALSGYEKALGPDHTRTLDTANDFGNLYNRQGNLKDAETKYQRVLSGYEKALGLDHLSTVGAVNNIGILYKHKGQLEEAEMKFWRALSGYEKALGPDDPSTLGTVINLGSLYIDQDRPVEAEKMFQRARTGFEKALGPDHTSTLNSINCLGILYLNQGKLKEAGKLLHRARAGYNNALGPNHSSTLSTTSSLGDLYNDQGKLEEAEKMFQLALAGYEKDLGPNHSSTLDAVNNLAVIYRDQGKVEDASQVFLRALEGYEKALGSDHTSTIRTANSLAILYRGQGKLEEAERMKKRALAGSERAFGPDHLSTLATANNLGNLYLDQGKQVEAENMYQQALAGYERTLDLDHPSTLRTVNNLGDLYRGQGKLEEAEKMYQRALSGYENAIGPNHLSTLDIVNNLGDLYRGQGKLDEAEKMFQRALTCCEKPLGLDHPSTLHAVNNLGNLYRAQGKLEEAEKIYQRVLSGCENAVGLDHPSTLATANNLGNIYRAQGKLEEAEKIYQRVLSGCENAVGLDHPSTLATANNLGNIYRDQGKVEEAEKMYQRALSGYEDAVGINHLSTLGIVNNLAVIYLNQSKPEEAERMYQRVLSGYKKALGPDHPSTLDTINNLAVSYLNQGKLEEAEKMFQRALLGYEKTLGPDHSFTLRTVQNLGQLDIHQGNVKEAEKMFQRALSGYETALGPDHLSTLDTVNNLAVVYLNQDKLKKAKELFQRALAGYETALGQNHYKTQAVAHSLNALAESAKPRRCKLLFKLFG